MKIHWAIRLRRMLFETNHIYVGNALDVLREFPSELIEMCVTSPPYWSLRDYGTEPVVWDGSPECEHGWERVIKPAPHGKGFDTPKKITSLNEATKSDFCSRCGAWRGSLGLEPTFHLYLSHLWQIFDAVYRVLRPWGSLWVNIGDTMSSHTDWRWSDWERKAEVSTVREQVKDLPKKCFCMIPERFALGMLDRGWVLRSKIIWAKKNCMPSSVKDSFTIDYENLYFFVKNTGKRLYWTNRKTLQLVTKHPKGIHGIEGKDWEWDTRADGRRYKRNLWQGHDYYFEQQFEPHTQATKDRAKYHWCSPTAKASGYQALDGLNRDEPYPLNPLGRNKRTVWRISTKSHKEAHFAIYPKELIEIPIQASCPKYVCSQCGMPKVKIIETKSIHKSELPKGHPDFRPGEKSISKRDDTGLDNFTATNKYGSLKTQIGWSFCACHAPFHGGLVLDPFFGIGTTGHVALDQGKRFVGVELSEKYAKMAWKALKPRVEQRKLDAFTN